MRSMMCAGLDLKGIMQQQQTKKYEKKDTNIELRLISFWLWHLNSMPCVFSRYIFFLRWNI